MKCQNCGAELIEGEIYCPECGQDVTPSSLSGRPKKKKSEIWTCLLLLLLVILGIPSCLLGGCFLLYASDSAVTGQTFPIGFVSLGLIGLVFFGALLAAFISARKKSGGD